MHPSSSLLHLSITNKSCWLLQQALLKNRYHHSVPKYPWYTSPSSVTRSDRILQTMWSIPRTTWPIHCIPFDKSQPWFFPNLLTNKSWDIQTPWFSHPHPRRNTFPLGNTSRRKWFRKSLGTPSKLPDPRSQTHFWYYTMWSQLSPTLFCSTSLVKPTCLLLQH